MDESAQASIIAETIAELEARGLVVTPQAEPGINTWQSIYGHGLVSPDFPGAYWWPLPPSGYVPEEPTEDATDWQEMAWRDREANR